jgi:hypothetical protein
MRILVVSLLLGTCLAACGEPETDAAAVAAAKCASAVHDELGLAESDTSLDTSDVGVTGDDAERRVEGRWQVSDGGSGRFTCVVVPDESDKLRGLRVTDLDVLRARDAGS